MSQDHTLMESRYELKYLISESTALGVRAFVQQHLELDEYGVGQLNMCYPVHSLYLDSDDWKIYWRTINGDKNRFKLRIRYYSDAVDSPAFFEIKRRMKDVILKQRCAVSRAGVQQVLAGQLPDPQHLVSKNPTEVYSLQRFIELMLTLDARPKMHVAYVREAYASSFNNEVRLTIDRNVRSEPCSDARLLTSMEHPLICTQKKVILELKFTGRFPNWYGELVRVFNCFQTGAAKYIEGVILHLNRDLSPRDVPRTLV
jgi:hypothetical protein